MPGAFPVGPAPRVGRAAGRYPLPVEIFFTSLLVLVGLLTTWFAGYVVYRLYADQR
ncbi:hypothetical protein SAMN04487818_109173 [Actinokineospora terrae]|uniref:Uncharacterized protein n=1 Tax=Actinokineospora terrae TaxID=155974 RepID=A0A1H9VXG8_9PSEU|nr:hypothetical protein SAMN04487818_109173 [Actinokineospora terrae]